MSSDQPRPQTPTRTADEPPQTDSKNKSESNARPSAIPARLVRTPGRRTSSNIELLVTEAELVGEGKELDNPAVPSDKVIETVLDRLDGRDLEPAWIAMRGEDDE